MSPLFRGPWPWVRILVYTLRRHGVWIRVDGGELVVDHIERLPGDVRKAWIAELTAYRPEIIAFLGAELVEPAEQSADRLSVEWLIASTRERP